MFRIRQLTIPPADKLEGNWKKGLDKGPMRGKWKGTLIDEAYDTSEEKIKEESTDKKEVSTEQKIHKKNYPLFPANWGVENVIVIPIRHCMIADGIVNQMEKMQWRTFLKILVKLVKWLN